jgi:hypothetical protein
MSISTPTSTLRDFDVAAFLRGQAGRGKSVPARLTHSLAWFETVFGLDLHTTSPLVRSQSHPPDLLPPAPPKQAKMVVVKMVADMEGFVRHAPTLPLRCYAGAFCCLAHGVLRWADLQWSWKIHLTIDALIGVCWKMKKKQCQVPWAAIRAGFTHTDWAGHWVAELEEAFLPAEDFVLRAVSRNGCRFTPRMSCFNDAMAMMRSLLILGGMEADVALQFTLHSWRHLLPTAARQLRLSDSDQVEIGHWTTGSAMPRRYDSAACVTELTAKAAILEAVGRGWALADPGCVAALPPPADVRCSLPPPH